MTATRADATPTDPDRNGISIWVLGFVVWTALALLSSAQTAVSLWSEGADVVWSRFLPRGLIDWYTCAVFTPFYFWMVRRWPLTRANAPRALAIYFGFTAVIVVLKYALHVPLINAITTDPTRRLDLGTTLTHSYVRESIAFWCMLAVILSLEYYRAERRRELREARLQTQLVEARLDALASQLQPHFLFNTIQGISTLIHRDPRAADTMLARLSGLLRSMLRADGGHEIPLDDELRLLDLYLGIVRERFGERMDARIEVEPATRRCLVPRFLLQPLVENALEHGVARRAGPCRIDVRARRVDDQLEITVYNDAYDGSPSSTSNGVGLSNTRARLRQLYDDNQTLESGPDGAGGYVVTMRLPWREAEGDA